MKKLNNTPSAVVTWSSSLEPEIQKYTNSDQEQEQEIEPISRKPGSIFIWYLRSINSTFPNPMSIP